MKHRSPRPSYGIDGPYYLFGLTAVSAVAVVAAFSSAGAGSAVLLGTLALATAIPAALGAIYVAKGKLAHRDRLLAQIAWRGDEQVLDVGTGGGLLMIGAARRVPEGRVFGVDLWRGADLSGNRRARTLGNAAIEGVADRVEVRDEDARSLSFPSATFDCVLSMLCLHNIQDGRSLALDEIARVLKPGGIVVLSDLAATAEYARHFDRLGFSVVHGPPVLGTFPFQRMVIARKPSAAASCAAVDG